MTGSPLAPLLSPHPPPFALLCREGRGEVELLLGEILDVDRVADIPLPTGAPGAEAHDVLALVPFRQVSEVGFDHHDDGTPLRCLLVTERRVLAAEEFLRLVPDAPVATSATGFDVDDESYAATVKRIITDEIGRGEGANFVIRRDFLATIEEYSPAVALTLFRRLLAGETGAYWTFVVHDGAATMVGATPERHVSARAGTVLMNPISGTYRYPPSGPERAGALRFLADVKEVEELYMVVDEELKMMSAVCDRGGQVLGPYLKEMGHLAHTEYILAGRSGLDVRDVLRGTMFAATVTGSPVPNACRVIAKYEPTGRGYYGAALALLGRDADGNQTLDAPILIRTLYIDAAGRVRLPVGATLVRHSRPVDEVAETYAKAAGVLAALGLPGSGPAPAGRAPADAAGRAHADAAGRVHADVAGRAHRGGTGSARRLGAGARLAEDPLVAAALAGRNRSLAEFWLRRQDPAELRDPALAGARALVVEAGDGWAAMLTHLLRMLGLDVTCQPWHQVGAATGYDVVVPGPGPGDPTDLSVPKMAALRSLIGGLLDARRPLLAVCLGHQALAGVLGLPVVAKDTPFQGTQREIDLFGHRERVGFYNTYAARCAADPPAGVELSLDPDSREVHALRAEGFAGVQFHPESILTTRGVDIARRLLTGLFGPPA